MSNKKSTGGHKGSSFEEDGHHDEETAVPSGGLSIRRNREMATADNKYPSARVDVASSSSFHPRTTTCDSLLYSGEVPISTLPPTLPFPETIDASELDSKSGDDREPGDRRSEDKDQREGYEGVHGDSRRFRDDERKGERDRWSRRSPSPPTRADRK
mmetsp:Transcript_20729/g.34888  ORF Transcript_20729/g.34888 Transcript_20729/m.34888 type:complete len:157 (-) Transcript_20729:904-1374(-)